LRRRVAKETASLLYSRVEKEYKQAKMKAMQNCGIRIMPTNFEVALELDELIEENEGTSRKEHLIDLRNDALWVMNLLRVFHPLLIGSVWRGTARKGSDIDVAVYTDRPEEILKVLKNHDCPISKYGWNKVTKRGKSEVSFHVQTTSSRGNEIEIVARNVAKMVEKRKCDLFGDLLTGLTIQELEDLLIRNPVQKLMPR